jgi:hypothetical protein
MASIQKFEDLEVWQKAWDLSKKIMPFHSRNLWLKTLTKETKLKGQVDLLRIM